MAILEKIKTSTEDAISNNIQKRMNINMKCKKADKNEKKKTE